VISIENQNAVQIEGTHRTQFENLRVDGRHLVTVSEVVDELSAVVIRMMIAYKWGKKNTRGGAEPRAAALLPPQLPAFVPPCPPDPGAPGP